MRLIYNNIAPETIIVFQKEGSDKVAPFLTGIDQFSLRNSAFIGDELWAYICKFLSGV